MTKRQDRSSHSPSIKELLEALTEEERRASAPSHMISPPPLAHSAARHHTAPYTSDPHDAHPAHVAHAMLAVQTNLWGNAAPQSVTEIEFEPGGGAHVSSFDRATHGAQVPRRAPPPPPVITPLIAIDTDDARREANHKAVNAHDGILRTDRSPTIKLLRSPLRVPWIARHVFAAAGALAVILPSAFYLTAPVLDRVANSDATARQTATIVQRGVAVTAMNAQGSDERIVTASQPPPSRATSRTDRFATASLGSVDGSAARPSATMPSPLQSEASPTNSQATPPIVAHPPESAIRPMKLSPDAARTMTPERAAALVARGRELALSRDITAARQYFLRAAEGGSALAALEAARTFDPVQLKEMGLVGLKADRERAQNLYLQAEVGGIAAAREMLARLAAAR